MLQRSNKLGLNAFFCVWRKAFLFGLQCLQISMPEIGILKQIDASKLGKDSDRGPWLV